MKNEENKIKKYSTSIKELKKLKRKQTINNIMANAICIDKITTNFAILLAPLAISATVVLGGSELFGLGMPFKVDNEKEYTFTDQTIENKEVTDSKDYTTSTSNIRLDDNKIYLQSPWVKTSDGYQREVDEYSFKKLTNKNSSSEKSISFDTLNDIVNTNNKDFVNIEISNNKIVDNLLSQPKHKIETKNKMPEDFDNIESIKAEVHFLDESKTKIIPESNTTNNVVTVVDSIAIIDLVILNYLFLSKMNYSLKVGIYNAIAEKNMKIEHNEQIDKALSFKKRQLKRYNKMK